MAGWHGYWGFLITNVILDVGNSRDLGEPKERNFGISMEIQVESSMAGWQQEMTVENLLEFPSGKEFFNLCFHVEVLPLYATYNQIESQTGEDLDGDMWLIKEKVRISHQPSW